MKTELTQARLKELLHYDPEHGLFIWRRSNSNRAPSGSPAGTPDGRGYLQIQVDRRLYKAHRLAFLYMTGAFPDEEVDHINRDGADNRWANLRSATRSQNESNKLITSRNTSGYRGVFWEGRCRKWQARGMKDKKEVYLGLFDDVEEAAAVAKLWREENFKEFAA